MFTDQMYKSRGIFIDELQLVYCMGQLFSRGTNQEYTYLLATVKQLILSIIPEY